MIWFALTTNSAFGATDDFEALCSDRMAIERVYYTHRLGDKSPFDQTLSKAVLENLVRNDLRKEALLKNAYGVEIAPAKLEAELSRSNTAARAPGMRAELKAALGNDAVRFVSASIYATRTSFRQSSVTDPIILQLLVL
jgi:hypothetical protein